MNADGQVVTVKIIKNNNAGMSIGAIVGIVIGAVVAVCALIALIYLCIKKPSAATKRLNEELEMPLLNE